MRLKNKIIAIILVLLFVAQIALSATSALAQDSPTYTNVWGRIEVDTVWVAEESPYKVIDRITIMDGASLTIEPGVEVYFDSSFLDGRRLTVLGGGQLFVNGTAADPVIFSTNMSIWNGISIYGSAEFSGAEITRGGMSGSSVLFKDGVGYLSLENCLISGSNGPGLLIADRGGKTDLVNSIFIMNNGAGIVISHNHSEEVEIINCTFEENRIGIHQTGGSKAFTLKNSIFIGNSEHGIRNDSGVEIDAQNSWWGSPTGPFHADLNPDGEGDAVSDGVLFAPWRSTLSNNIIISPVRSGTLIAGDTLRFSSAEPEEPVAVHKWEFSDGRNYDTRNPGLVIFNEPGEVDISYKAFQVDDEDPFPDTRSYTVVADTGNAPDLTVLSVSVPQTAAVGQLVEITYEVENVGQGPASQPWIDSVYLSSDGFLDLTDTLLVSQEINGDLAVGETYQNSLTVNLPAVDEGVYNLIIVVDSQWQVLELQRLNNEKAVPVTVQVPVLIEGVDHTATYSEGQLEHYYRVPVTAGKNLLLNFLSDNPGLDVYVSYNTLPTQEDFDYRLSGSNLLIPAATSGNWYVLVTGAMAQVGSYSLNYLLQGLALISGAPSRHGTDTDLELVLTGAGFAQPLIVELIDRQGVSYPAAVVEVDSFERAVATFKAGELPADTYTIRISLGDSTAELTDAVMIIAGAEGALETNLILPANIGYNTLATIYVEYTNSGDASMPAPLLTLTAFQHDRQDGILTLEHHKLSRGFWADGMPHGFSNSVQFLASGVVPGILRPGEKKRVPVYYAGWLQPWDTSIDRPPIEWELSELTVEDTTNANWSAFKDEMKPVYIREDAWDVIWNNYTELAGETWGDYVAMLNRNASYLYRQGQRVEDTSSLMALSMRLADSLSPLTVLDDSVDAAVLGSGMPIVFERIYLQPISRRFEQGDLGRGWTHNWRQSLTIGEDEAVVISDMTGTPRIFNPDRRYTGRYLAQPGDEGVLIAVSDGFRLTEQTGEVQFYRDGRLEYVEDTNGNRITCTYSNSQLTQLAHSGGGSLHITYSGGFITSISDHQGRVTQYSYTGEYLTSVQVYDGLTTTYAYDTTPGARQHALTTIGLPDGTSRTYEYESKGLLSAVWRDEQQEKITFLHADTGRIDIKDAIDNTSMFYFDHWGRAAKKENALGETQQMEFDQLGNLISVTDQDGRSVMLVYDRRGNLVEFTDTLRRTTKFGYTRAFNHLAVVTDAMGRQTQHSYDVRGNLIAMIYPDGSRETWAYDSYGNPTTWTNRRSSTVSFEYDADGRLTRKGFADSSSASYRYDNRGNLIEAEDEEGKTVFKYNEHDYLLRVEYPGGRWLNFTYDSVGRRVSSEDQLGYILSYHYDQAGRLSRLSDIEGDIVVYSYDELGRLTRKTMGNGVYTLYSYDSISRLTSLINHDPDGAILSSFSYIYNRSGQVEKKQTHYGEWLYEYDETGQLTRAAFESTIPEVEDQMIIYSYDKLGNLIKKIVNGEEQNYTTNLLNQYTRIDDVNYTYDADGNLTREDGPGGVVNYIYNDFNQLISVTKDAIVLDYTYDALGNRVAKSENETVTNYLIDPIGIGNLVGEYDSQGEILNRYTHGLTLVSGWNPAADHYYFSYDHAGNTSTITAATGEIVNSYFYEPNGTSLYSNETMNNAFQFMGQFGIMVENDDLHFVRARYYKSDLGRFTSADPIGLNGGDINLYRYVHNDPVNSFDFTGLRRSSAITSGSGAGICGYIQGASTLATGIKLLGVGAALVSAPAAPAVAVVGAIVISGYGIMRIRQGVNQVGNANIDYSLHHRPKYYGASKVIDMTTDFIDTSTDFNPLMTVIGMNVDAFCAWNKNAVDTPGSRGNLIWNGFTWVIASWDPNEKTTVAGYGEGNYIKDGSQLTYRIDFENYESATAPAQIVTIRDPLSSHLDHSTLELAEFGFGDILVSIPPGLQHYETIIDYYYSDDDYEFEVEVHVEFWLENGVLHFNFFTYDPDTGLPPPAEIGFLMPETDPATGRGQGYVSYLIKPESGLPSGQEIRNIATIQFDYSLEIDTNQVDPLDPSKGTDPDKEALVTIDSVAPISSVNELPAVTETENFTVSWSGEDDVDGSGIGKYDICVRENSGVWTLWQQGTDETSAQFTGENSKTYDFYSVTTDNVGNREIKEPLTEASIEVVLSQPPQSHQITLSSNPVVGGQVNGAGTYNIGHNLTVSAIPSPGFVFINWTEDGAVVSTDQEYTFIVDRKRELVANFKEVVTETYILALTTKPESGGTATDLIGTGPYEAKSMVSIKAVPNEGYYFSHWTASAGNFYNASAAETTFTMPAENVVVTANFKETLLIGDVNGDGAINVKDVALAMKFSLELEVPTEKQKIAADVNKDGKIDVRDVVLIMRYALKIIDEF